MRTIAFYGRNISEENAPSVEAFFSNLVKLGVSILIYKPLLEGGTLKHLPDHTTYERKDEIPEDTDLIISIGGDGTLLDSTVYSRNFKIPILGLNTGRLGFLTGLNLDQLEHSTRALLDGDFDIEERRCFVKRSSIFFVM